jgi:hypothetical protein
MISIARNNLNIDIAISPLPLSLTKMSTRGLPIDPTLADFSASSAKALKAQKEKDRRARQKANDELYDRMEDAIAAAVEQCAQETGDSVKDVRARAKLIREETLKRRPANAWNYAVSLNKQNPVEGDILFGKRLCQPTQSLLCPVLMFTFFGSYPARPEYE